MIIMTIMIMSKVSSNRIISPLPIEFFPATDPHPMRAPKTAIFPRRNMSNEFFEFAEGRMKPERHSAIFGLPALQPRIEPESGRTKAESARTKPE
jgi:hypothetical protein